MPPPGYSSYFIAVVPPAPLRNELWELKHYFREHYNSKASLNSPPHITLHMPFQWRLTKEKELVESLHSFCSLRTPISIHLQNFDWFEPRVIFVAVEANETLRFFQQELMRYGKINLNLFHAQYRDLPYRPHLTLAFRDLKKEQFYRAQQEFRARTFQAEFKVDSVALLKHDGKIWNILTEFPLLS